MIPTKKNIYSLVLSDDVVEAVDNLARAQGLSRSAMINQILAERVAYTTPEMRMREVLASIQRSMGDVFYLTEQPSAGTLLCRSSLKYRYQPTVKYSVELFSHGGRRVGELRVSFRTKNSQLINDLVRFFTCWAGLEQKYIADKISQDIIYSIETGKFTRTLNMPQNDISDDDLGQTVADYMTMFDEIMKAYFAELPEEKSAAAAAENAYAQAISNQKYII